METRTIIDSIEIEGQNRVESGNEAFTEAKALWAPRSRTCDELV
jgi:hypothetical protein